MIKALNLSYSFPQKDLYNKISFTLEYGKHCAFIGTSGSGKSTLIDIIRDPERYMFDGKLDVNPSCRIGYVSQFSHLDEMGDLSVFQYIAKEFIRLQGEISAICTEMETGKNVNVLVEKYQQALDAFDAIGGDDFESNINKKLNLANLGKHENLPVAQLSGGEFKLVQVIKEMLVSPDLMIMDEPDVFLDFDKINALKDLINSHKGTMLVITHNKYLLNHCFNKIIHLENMELTEFDGRYIEYNFSLLQRKIELTELANTDTEEIERNEILIDKLRDIASSNAEAARGKSLNARVKIQERLEARRINAPWENTKQLDIKFATNTEEKETTVLKIDNYSVSFDDVLLNNISFEIKASDKVALIGANGTGKTTLLRAIYKNQDKSIVVSENVEIAYCSQLQGEMLNENNTIFDEFFEAGFKSYDDIIEYLAGFSFNEEYLTEKISCLSGGEKNILQLAKASASTANLLLLDEPTSHLDTYSQIALERAIESYNGAILMISHDYYSIASCMDYVLVLENKKLKKISIDTFKNIMFKNHINKDYIKIEQKRKIIEDKIDKALKAKNYEDAKILADQLSALIKAY